MKRRSVWALGLVAVASCALALGLRAAQDPAPPAAAPAAAAGPKIAPSRVTHVTVYQTNALVTREVEVPEGAGLTELVVSPMPAQTEDGSLYAEGSDGLRVLTARYRSRAILEDPREEVRKLHAQLVELQREGQRLQSEAAVIQQNLQLLANLEKFTGANLQHQTEKGTLNSDAILSLTKYVMDMRADKAPALVAVQQKLQDNKEQIDFKQRQLREQSAGRSRTERDAMIVVDVPKGVRGKVRLHYLVQSASWHPQYKFRAGNGNGNGKQPVQLEYMAAVRQQSGEDWRDVALTLSTAQPMLNAAPPELSMLEVAVAPMAGQPGAGPGGPGGLAPMPVPPGRASLPADAFRAQQQEARRQALMLYNAAPQPQAGQAKVGEGK